MNAYKFVAEHGVEQAKSILEKSPETATHFTKALGGHYAKEVVLKMRPQWAWFNTINNEWYYDFAAKEHIELAELKHLFESVEIVEQFGNDLVGTKQLLDFANDCKTIELSGSVITVARLEQAITDYELVDSYRGGKND